MIPTVALIAAAVLLVQLLTLVLLGWRLARLSRQVTALAGRRPEAHGDVPVSLLVTALSRLEQRLARMEQAQSDTPQATQGGGSDRSYQLAQRLARQGASAEQITEACGISLQEAELLLRLHAPQA